MDKKLEYAKRWFDKAKSDLLDADNNLAADKVPYDTVCFHCQYSLVITFYFLCMLATKSSTMALSTR